MSSDADSRERLAAGLPAHAIDALREQNLAELVRFVAARSPFFRRRLGPAARAFLGGTPVSADTVRTAGGDLVKRDLAALPIVSLGDIARESGQILTDPRVTLDMIRRGARGDSASENERRRGRPTFHFVAGANATRDLYLPFAESEWNEQSSAIFHRTPIVAALTTPKRARVVSFVPRDGASAPGRLLAKLSFLRRLRAAVRDVNQERVEAEIPAIRAFAPTTLWGAAGPIEVLASHALTRRWDAPVRWIVVPAEDLTPGRRALIQSAFPLATVIAWLGASLGLPIAVSCLSHGTLHLVADHFVVEPVGPDLRGVPVGVEGSDILLTALRMRTLPIVRLVLPFRGRLLPSCPCGSGLPPIEVEGSDGDLVWFPAGAGDRMPIPCGTIVDRLLLLPGVARARATLDESGVLKLVFVTTNGHRSDHVAPQVLSEVDSILRGRPVTSHLRVTIEEVGPGDPLVEAERPRTVGDDRRAQPRAYLQEVK